jgi:mRNA interferase MazF
MYSNLNLEVKRGDIYLTTLDGCVGSEQGGVRPVIIMQNDIGNRFSPTAIGVSVTSEINKAKLPTHVEIVGYGLEKQSVILAEQIRTIDKKRIIKYIGHLDEYMMEKVENALRVSLKIGDTQKEKIAKDKALKIEKIECVLATLSQYGQTDNIVYKDKLKTRELYLNDLENFCSINKLNYKDFYKQEQLEQKIAV